MFKTPYEWWLNPHLKSHQPGWSGHRVTAVSLISFSLVSLISFFMGRRGATRGPACSGEKPTGKQQKKDVQNIDNV